jgi:hypothetical protein
MKTADLFPFAALVAFTAVAVAMVIAPAIAEDQNQDCLVAAYDSCLRNSNDSADCLRQIRLVCEAKQ